MATIWPQLLWVILQNFEMLWPKKQPIYYERLMLGCEEKNIEESYFLATKFSNKANLCICSNILVEMLCYHIPSSGNGDAAYVVRAVMLMLCIKMAQQHLTTQ